jgi:hypothetical protein
VARIDRAFKFSIAFLIVPPAIPAIEFAPREWHSSYQLPVIFLTAVFAYLGAFVFGTSGYLFLRARKWTAFWFAPALGFVAGGLAWWLFTSMPRTAGIFHFDPDLRFLREVLWPYGPVGAVVGSLLWLIARPDRAVSPDAARREQYEPAPPNA